VGRSSRKRKHDDRMKQKRAEKAAKAAKYKALAGTSKRAKRQHVSSMPSGIKHAHVMSNCGNVGCRQCNPRLNP
jgi:hypothetical protein